MSHTISSRIKWNQLGATDAEVRDVLAKLPPCYSQQFFECIREFEAADTEKRAPKLTSYCAPFWEIRSKQPEAWDAATDLQPYCSEPGKNEGLSLGAIAGIGLGVGLLIAALAT